MDAKLPQISVAEQLAATACKQVLEIEAEAPALRCGLSLER